jgi:hypothetical protein
MLSLPSIKGKGKVSGVLERADSALSMSDMVRHPRLNK